MDKPSYHFKTSPDALTYEFESISVERVIRKVVVYEPLDEEVYHFGFGDLRDDGTIDYTVASNNQDRDKVLATVVKTMLLFFERYPGKQLAFTGSTAARSRLYRQLIARFIETIEPYFDVQGLRKEGLQEPFQKNQDYFAFIISQRYEEA